MEVILVARSVGKRTRAEQLRREGHAGLVLNLGRPGVNDHWLVQGGPSGDFLAGGGRHCPSHGWYHEFATARGAVWESGETLTLPVVTLMAMSAIPLTAAQIAVIANEINQRRLRYNYETGPNSNTYVRMFLERMGVSVPTPPSGKLPLRGWGWR